jgi:tetrahydrodipicolinate N-succinyltransferase
LYAGDEGSIRIGNNSNVQDNSTIQSNKSFLGEHHGSTSIGDNVTVGHGVFADSVTIEDEALIGMGATLLQGVKVPTKSLQPLIQKPWCPTCSCPGFALQHQGVKVLLGELQPWV